MLVYLRDGCALTIVHAATPSHTKTEVADQTFYLTQSQHTDTGSTSPSTDPIRLGAWQGIAIGVPMLTHLYDPIRKNPGASRNLTPGLLLSRRTS